MAPKTEATAGTPKKKTANPAKKTSTASSASRSSAGKPKAKVSCSAKDKQHEKNSKPNNKAIEVSTVEGGLERVLDADSEDVMRRAEGGEMSSDSIMNALARPAYDMDMPLEEAATEGVRQMDLGPAGDDPWGALDRAAEWEALEEEQAVKVVVEREDVLARGAEVALETKIRQRFGAGATQAVAVVASDCGLDSFPMAEHSRACAVQLDLRNSKLQSIESIVSRGFLWLRELKLAGNKLKGWPQGFEALPALLSLDLSFNDGIRLTQADLSPLAGLWTLDLAGCGLESLTGDEDDADSTEVDCKITPLAACVSLTDVNLSENLFTRLGALNPLTQLPQLRILDIQDNEDLCNVRNLKKEVLTMLPKIVKFNGDNTGIGSGAKFRGPIVYKGSGSGTVFGNNEDRSSCSCIEGNPCAFPANCNDWKGRYTVAMSARKKKGYDAGIRGTDYHLG